jgi:hypothetical protein
MCKHGWYWKNVCLQNMLENYGRDFPYSVYIHHFNWDISRMWDRMFHIIILSCVSDNVAPIILQSSPVLNTIITKPKTKFLNELTDRKGCQHAQPQIIHALSRWCWPQINTSVMTLFKQPYGSYFVPWIIGTSCPMSVMVVVCQVLRSDEQNSVIAVHELS